MELQVGQECLLIYWVLGVGGRGGVVDFHAIDFFYPFRNCMKGLLAVHKVCYRLFIKKILSV